MTARERSMMFSASMVRALLAGRKTQTRRLVKFTSGRGALAQKCPYGQPGDRIWVREGLRKYDDSSWYYIADLAPVMVPADDPRMVGWARDKKTEACPAIFMPSFARRIALDLTAARAERLQSISEEDARAEGLTVLSKDGGRVFKYGIPDRDGWPGTDDDGWEWQDWNVDPRKALAHLWDQINGKRAPWAKNPWVWALTFSVVQPPRAAAQPASEDQAGPAPAQP